MNCPLCDSPQHLDVLQIPSLPSMVNRLATSEEAALHAPMGSMELVMCCACGHLYNRVFVPEAVSYDTSYGNALHVSPTYRSYIWQLARMLVRDHHWTHQTLLDIGCGQGYFLRLLCALGANRGIGIDPAGNPATWSQTGKLGGELQIIQSEFAATSKDLPGQKVVCQHLIEHLNDPSDFLDMVGSGPEREEHHEMLIEVPNGLFTLRDNGFWDLIHEHVSYFTPGSILNWLGAAGYSIRLCRESYGKQFITVIASRRKQGRPRVKKHFRRGTLQSLAYDFGRRYRTHLAQWNIALKEWSESGWRILVWGAGSKGSSFVNQLKEPYRVEALIDQNPDKQGQYVPGTAHPIVNVDSVPPGDHLIILVMNHLYIREIHTLLQRSGLNALIVSVMEGPQMLPRAAIPALM
jgi:hypothetical protein